MAVWDSARGVIRVGEADVTARWCRNYVFNLARPDKPRPVMVNDIFPGFQTGDRIVAVFPRDN